MSLPSGESKVTGSRATSSVRIVARSLTTPLTLTARISGPAAKAAAAVQPSGTRRREPSGKVISICDVPTCTAPLFSSGDEYRPLEKQRASRPTAESLGAPSFTPTPANDPSHSSAFTARKPLDVLQRRRLRFIRACDPTCGFVSSAGNEG